MNLRHLLVSILGLGILTSCKNSGYQKKNGLVYYQERLVGSADYGSFESLNPVFARDQHQAYYRGQPLASSTGASFTALDEYYGRDNQAVFYCSNYIDFKLFETTRKDKIIQISTADASSFEVITNEYARDKFRCYYQGIGFAVNKVASFEPLDYDFGRDEQVGYFEFITTEKYWLVPTRFRLTWFVMKPVGMPPIKAILITRGINSSRRMSRTKKRMWCQLRATDTTSIAFA